MFTKEQLREAMPGVAKIVDQVREYFPDSKLVYAKEGGLEIGESSEGKGIVPSCLNDYRPPETEQEKWLRLKREAVKKNKRRS
jgi:hypothetical protein